MEAVSGKPDVNQSVLMAEIPAFGAENVNTATALQHSRNPHGSRAAAHLAKPIGCARQLAAHARWLAWPLSPMRGRPQVHPCRLKRALHGAYARASGRPPTCRACVRPEFYRGYCDQAARILFHSATRSALAASAASTSPSMRIDLMVSPCFTESTTSRPSSTLPNTVCLPSSQSVLIWVTKNWLPLVLGPALAIEITPRSWRTPLLVS